jgi:hypothetical protein
MPKPEDKGSSNQGSRLDRVAEDLAELAHPDDLSKPDR